MTDADADARRAARATVQAYVDACRAGDAAALRGLFHPQALMSGHLQGQLLLGSPEPFFQAVEQAPAPAASGEPYRFEIGEVSVAGEVASTTLREWDYLGMDFTDFFHLLRTDAGWRIIAKTFHQGT